MTPLPLDVDRLMVQRILDDMGWLAIPIKQVGPSTWIVGSSQSPPQETVLIRNQLVLISQEQPRPTIRGSESVILAAPTSVRRALDKSLRQGDTECWDTRPVVARDPQASTIPAPAPQMVSKTELEQKVSELQQQLTSAVGSMEQKISSSVQGIEQRVACSVQGAQTAAQQTLEQVASAVKCQESRIDRLDEQVQQVAASSITKVDLTSILSEALAKQNSDFQRMLAKRPGDPSPLNDASSKASKQV